MDPNLPAAAAAVFVGAAQALLGVALFGAAFSGRKVKMLVSLVGKIAVYGGFFYLLFTVLRAAIVGAAVGFGVGFFPGLIVWSLLKGAKQLGGGKNG